MRTTTRPPSAADLEHPAAPLSQDDRVAQAAKSRRFGYVLLVVGAFWAVIAITMAVLNSNPLFLILQVTTVLNVVFALRQFAAARLV